MKITHVRPGFNLYLLLFLMVFCDPSLWAQRVRHMNIDNGLCTNSLTDLTLDRKGNMWIGSLTGLMKFSGTHVKSFTKIGNTNDAISGPEMHSVTEDHCGFIWIGTTAGLDKIHPFTYEIEHFPIRSPYKGSSSVGYIYAVFADRFDFIWISTDVALFRMDAITGSYEVIPIGRDEFSIHQQHVSYNGFVEDENGIWISTGAGMAYYEYATKKYFHRYHNPEDKDIFKITQGDIHMQSDMEMDSSGRLWFVLENTYLTRYTISTDKIDTFKLDRPFGAWKCCYSIGVDARQNIWVGTRHGGVMVFNTTTGTFTSLKYDGVNRLLKSDYIYAIERGPDGNMFVAHDNGLDIIDLYDTSLREYKLSEDNDFLNLKYQSGDIALDVNEESIYIPFYNFGFLRFYPKDGHAKKFKDVSSEPQPITFIYNWSGKTYVSKQGNMFEASIGSDNYVIDSDGVLPAAVASTRTNVAWSYFGSAQSMYVKKSSGNMYHIDQNEIKTYSTYGFSPNACISPDSQVLSYLTTDLNLVRIQLKTGQEDTFFIQDKLVKTRFSFANSRHIIDDGRSVWMTGQNGILRYILADDQLMIYGMEKGLSHSLTFSLVLDLQNNLWVGNLGGIDRYDATEDRFIAVHHVKGNAYMEAFGSAVGSKAGELFFHFGNKLVRIQPHQIERPEQTNFKVHLSEVRVNGNNIDFQDQKKLDHLSYHENRLTFLFDILRYTEVELVSFYYRLNGKEWIANGQRNEVNLDGLASGDYILELKGSIGRQSNSSEVLPVSFRIRPPFWKTWWFVSGILLLLLGLVMRYIQLRDRRMKEKAALGIQMAQLKSTALKAQMNPHFVFNSLNAIQECIVTGKVDEAYTYLSKFSKLLRIVLEHSDKSGITMHDELEVLSLYLSLEQLRFKDEMFYHIHVDPKLDTDEIQMPPLLIQPHLENAIWHGLRFKEGSKKLQLTITETRSGYLDVTIEDNGIGREKAREIQKGKLSREKSQRSMGKKLSEDQLALLVKKFPETAIEITDIFDEHLHLAGTRVHMTLPILNKSFED